ncbi:polypyrimidine tract-binding protein homolog 3 [Tanacetum coccineum]|uniref:Polypyrimidine tract-binding protein homolog 3 n=1 Tax=Tanacetum coccineum TaxID=301880 RepID=A0ABQ5B7B9_9ASTR
MASGDNECNAEDVLFKLLQMGTVAEYHNEFEMLIQREERPTIAIAKPNDLAARVQVQDLEQTTQGRGDEPNRILLVTIHHMLYHITVTYSSRQNARAARNSLHGRNIYDGCCQLDIQFLNLEELQVNQDDNVYYYWENCFSILNANGADNTKLPLSVDTFENNGGDDSELHVCDTWKIGIGDVHGLMNNGSIHSFVQPNAGERMRLRAMVMGRSYQWVGGSPEEATWE